MSERVWTINGRRVDAEMFASIASDLLVKRTGEKWEAEDERDMMRTRLEALADEWEEAQASGGNGRHGFHASEYGDLYAADLRAALNGGTE